MIFLIEYDRNRGEIVTMHPFDDSERSVAENARLEMELRLRRAQVDREIVLLEASNEQALRRTHRRYFENLRELAKAPVSEDR